MISQATVPLCLTDQTHLSNPNAENIFVQGSYWSLMLESLHLLLVICAYLCVVLLLRFKLQNNKFANSYALQKLF